MLVAAMGFVCAGAAPTASPEMTPMDASSVRSAQFTQLDVTLLQSGLIVKRSNWGALDLTFDGSHPVSYVNLSVDGRWVVRNVPALSDGTPAQKLRLTFPLGTRPGEPVRSLHYGLTVWKRPSPTAPAPSATAVVRSGAFIIGCKGGGGPKTLPDAKPLRGTELAPGEKPHLHPADFPNHPSAPMECGPTALLNSLEWLKKQFPTELSGVDVSLAAMKTATGFNKGVDSSWPQTKARYMKQHDIPIQTTVGVAISEIGNKLDQKCDVELDSGRDQAQWHVAAVVGIAKLADGSYEVKVNHDTTQGQPNGTKTEPLIIDHNKITGGAYFDGLREPRFIVECVKKKTP